MKVSSREKKNITRSLMCVEELVEVPAPCRCARKSIRSQGERGTSDKRDNKKEDRIPPYIEEERDQLPATPRVSLSASSTPSMPYRVLPVWFERLLLFSRRFQPS